MQMITSNFPEKVSDRAQKSIAEHKQILEAILASDPDEAERLTSVHIDNALRNFKAQTS